MPKNDLARRLMAMLGLAGPAKESALVRFRDPLGNFVLSCPQGWKTDRDVAVVEGAYTISLGSPDGRASFTVAVDTNLRRGFDFRAYVRRELEAPSSGILAPVKKSEFRGMPAFARDYAYSSGSCACFAGGIAFFTGRAVFSVSWSGPESSRKTLEPLFTRMLGSLMILPGMSFASGKF